MLDMACGMTAGVAYVVSAHPFDTVKVAQQSRPTGAPALSALATARAIARGPAGPLGLFKGLSAPLVGYSLESGINYSAYSQARQWLDASGPWAGTPRDAKPPSAEILEAAASGALGGLLLSVVVAPTDLIKCRVQDGQYAGPRDAVADIYRRDGARGFTRGAVATLAREIPGNAIFFATYELAQSAFPRWTRAPGAGGEADEDDDSAATANHRASDPGATANHRASDEDPGATANQRASSSASASAYYAQESLAAVTCGGVAGSAFWLTMLPVDYAKTRIQIARRGDPDDASVLGLMARTFRERGVKGLYAGAGPVLLRAFPTNAVQFLAWEAARQVAGVGRA
jgi:solute carrier family 25 carnitine/acylcarnitine transporter 20/29